MRFSPTAHRVCAAETAVPIAVPPVHFKAEALNLIKDQDGRHATRFAS